MEEERFTLTEDHVEVLRKHAVALQSYHSVVGQQFCELMKNVEQAKTIEHNINTIQEDIAKELGVPRSDRLIWDLNNNYVEVMKQT